MSVTEPQPEPFPASPPARSVGGAVARVPLRVVMSSPTWSLNGVNVFSARLAAGLGERGVEARILISRPRRRDPKPLAPPDPRAVRLEEFHPGRAFTWGARARAFARAIMGGGARGGGAPTTLYLPNYDYEHSVASALLPPEVVVVGIVHSDDPEHYDHLRRLGRYWNGVVAVSRAIGERILAEGLAAPERLRVIPYGVESDEALSFEEAFAPDATIPSSALPSPGASPLPSPDASSRPLRIVYAGRIARAQKRVFDLIDIARELRARGVAFTLTVAGGGPDEAAFRERAGDLIDDGAIRMAGILGPDALADLFRASEVCLLVSEFEGLPIALLEAMGRGCAPVASDIASGVPEVVRDGENGLLAPVGDVGAFADRIASLARDRATLELLRRAAHASVRSGPYGVGAMTDAYLAFFEQLAIGARAGGFKRPRDGFPPPGSLPALWRYRVPEPLRPAAERLARIVRFARERERR